jgi:hypothetical protein
MRREGKSEQIAMSWRPKTLDTKHYTLSKVH